MALQSVGTLGTGMPLPAAPPQGNAGSPPAAPAPEVQIKAAPQQPAHARAQVEQVVHEIKDLLKPMVSNALNFSIDDSTGKTIVRITDGETGEVIRQIPAEEMLEIARSMDRMQGLLLRQKA